MNGKCIAAVENGVLCGDAAVDTACVGMATAKGAGKHFKTKVVVIGAGMAGVAAAAKLIHNGIKDVLVLEAQDYVGGRIKSQVVGGKVLDMGAMFVHGQEGNPIYELVRRLNVEAADINHLPNHTYSSNNEKLSIERVEDLLDILEDRQGKWPSEVGHNKREMLTNLYEEFLHTKQISTDHPKKELYKAVFQFFCFYDCTEEACKDLSEVSAWAESCYVRCAGNSHTLIKGGYSTVLSALLKLIPKDVIRTGTPVHSVDWKHPKDGGILVHCQNGDVIATDHVIVTISLGCLKAVHSSMFSPSLPDALVNSMERVTFGTIGKIFVKWDPPFWDEEGAMYNFFWLESHPLMLKQDKSKKKTCFGNPWWYEIAGCHSVRDHEGFLLFWFLQHQMEAIRDVDDQEILDVLHELMQLFICDVNVPKPSAMYRTNWEENPYIRGTFSYCKPSFDETDARNMSTPVFPTAENPRLLLAGESFTMEYMTTTHGAFVTGELQADAVLRANGIIDRPSIVDAVAPEK